MQQITLEHQQPAARRLAHPALLSQRLAEALLRHKRLAPAARLSTRSLLEFWLRRVKRYYLLAMGWLTSR